MTTKQVQFRISEQTHQRLKVMATLANISIGDLLMVLEESFRCRFEAAKQEIDFSLPSPYDSQIFWLVHDRDCGVVSNDAFQKGLFEIKKEIETAKKWTPVVR